jgi:hypothetical protein
VDTLILLVIDRAWAEDSDILDHLPGMFLAGVGEVDIPARKIGMSLEVADYITSSPCDSDC